MSQKINKLADTSSFDVVYANHYSSILSYISFKVKDYRSAEELTNDTFIKVYKHLKEFDVTKSALTTWIRNIANNTIIDYFRADAISRNEVNMSVFADAETGKEYFSFIADNDSQAILENKEFMSLIAEKFRALKPQYRKIATLYFLRDMSYKDIAEICDMPMNIVKVSILRCRAILQEQLQEQKKEFAIG